MENKVCEYSISQKENMGIIFLRLCKLRVTACPSACWSKAFLDCATRKAHELELALLEQEELS
jgi:hypothetical protein